MKAPTLFDFDDPPKRRRVSRGASDRAAAGATRAADRAERVDPGWKKAALEQVRAFARSHSEFIIDYVGLVVPDGADPRSIGAVAQAAQRQGILEHAGYIRTERSNGSPRALWRSLIYAGPIL